LWYVGIFELQNHENDHEQNAINLKEELIEQDLKLNHEASSSNDIVFLDMIDVYSHLPIKLLKTLE